MITEISELSNFTQLAVASYARFNESSPQLALVDKANMTEAQAADFPQFSASQK